MTLLTRLVLIVSGLTLVGYASFEWGRDVERERWLGPIQRYGSQYGGAWDDLQCWTVLADDSHYGARAKHCVYWVTVESGLPTPPENVRQIQNLPR